MLVKKQTGELETFDPFKLESSLRRAGAKQAITDEIVQKVTAELHKGASTRQIYRKAFALLKNRKRGLAARYSLKRAIADLGPSGFPFEQMIARIFESQGYNTRTGVMVQGHCVPHEVDVLAQKEDELILVEAKFHNDESIKSDSKDVLYIKARFDDLRDKDIEFSSEITLKMTNGMLITNTKFSSSAVQYSQCSNLDIVGWSYPERGSLRELIEASNLHPLTCLTSLSNSQKRLLLEKKMVLCKEVQERSDVLKEVGVGEKEKEEVLKEIDDVLSLL